jgi:hypothetical protein
MYLKHVNMTKKAYNKLIAGHLQWSIIGVFLALLIAFATSDHRSVVYGVPAAESSVTEVSGVPAPLPFPAPASAPKVSVKQTVPDTVNGVLLWPDPWDQISEPSLRNY